MKSKLMACLVALFMVASLGTLCAAVKDPVQNISDEKHPNLATAQDLLQKAFDEMTLAQKANEGNLGGNAAKAKALIGQASQDLKRAAKASNKNKSHNPDADTSNIDSSAVNTKINAERHPHLAAAQDFLAKAYEKMVAAQKANEYDLDGWAHKAKDLTVQASKALVAAAKESNKNRRAAKNLEAALKALEVVSAKMGQALESKEFDNNGHAQKAQELIDQAQKELEAALEGDPAAAAPAPASATEPVDGGM